MAQNITLETEKLIKDMATKIINDNAQQIKSKLTTLIRPLTVLTMAVLVALDATGIVNLSANAYDLIKIVMGGYIASRGIEKVMHRD